MTLDVQANDDILQQLQRMQDADQPMPDLVQDDTFLIEAYNAAGLVLPFDEQMPTWEEEDPDEFANILPIAWEENLIEGETLGSSLTANFDILYYNVALFERPGSTRRRSTLSMESSRRCGQPKAARPDAIPLTVQALPTTGVTLLKTFLSAAGAPFEGAVPDLQSPGGIYTLEWFLRGRRRTAAAGGDLLGEGEARGVFLAQDAA